MARRERKHAWNKSNEIIIMMPMFVADLKSRPNTIINMVELCPIGKEKSIQSSIPYIIPVILVHTISSTLKKLLTFYKAPMNSVSIQGKVEKLRHDTLVGST